MQTPLSRRRFVLRAVTAGTGLALAGLRFPRTWAAESPFPEPTPDRLPRWRGFNLLEKFNGRNDRFREQDFEWIAELGFNFVRLPMDYRMWIENKDWTKLHEPTLKEIDEAIGFGGKHGLHVLLNFHRAPGYTVARPPEEKSVWTDREALRVCTLHWTHFAKRYRGIPNRRLSFNLFNEPPRIEPDQHRNTIAHLVEAIRMEDPNRLILCDGREWGNAVPTELVGLNVAAATRGYQPMPISHYRASWVNGSDRWAEPTYPLKVGETTWDKASMRERLIRPWLELQQKGMGVMVGEFGAHNQTPHAVVLGWMRDLIALWKEAGWGYALWNFRGSFGVLDSGRSDVQYEDWRGHKLDRAMLKLLQADGAQA